MGWTVTPTTLQRGAIMRVAECVAGSLYTLNSGEIALHIGPLFCSSYHKFSSFANGQFHLLHPDTSVWELSAPVQLVFDPRK